MARQIALLRGINLGAKRRLAMSELTGVLLGAGYQDVTTYLQSGNVVLSGNAAAATLEQELAGLISKHFGMDVPVVVRNHEDLQGVLELNPLGEAEEDAARYLVTFLPQTPPVAAAEAALAADVAPERLAIHGREIYSWHPAGVQRSALLQLLSRHGLSTDGTARNWNTVRRLAALSAP